MYYLQTKKPCPSMEIKPKSSTSSHCEEFTTNGFITEFSKDSILRTIKQYYVREVNSSSPNVKNLEISMAICSRNTNLLLLRQEKM